MQTYKEWQQAHPELGVSEVDTGIDLVATLREPQNDAVYVAIQCKFYREHSALSMKDLATFLSVSSTPFFASRLLVATNRGLNSHAQKQVANQEKPLQIISLETLRQFPIDWAQFVQTNTVCTLPKRQLRPYQQTAVTNTINGFKDYARGKLIMACGTGKTFTALRIAERQAQQNHLVLFLVPSLSLLSQSMNDWVQQSQLPMLAIPVCSDNKVSYKKVSKHESEADENVLARNELLYPATTNEHALARSVAKALAMQQKQPQQGLVVVFSTYQSLDEAHHTAGAYLLNDESAVAKAKASEQAPTFDDKPTLGGLPTDDTLEVKAQAQESAPTKGEQASLGDVSPDAIAITKTAKKSSKKNSKRQKNTPDGETYFTLVHNPEYFHGRKRLYMTATPKVYGVAPKKQVEENSAVIYSMDDENVFGPVFYSLTFEQAVSLGCLVDYKVIILVRDGTIDMSSEELEQFSAQNTARAIGLWKSLNKFGILSQDESDAQPIRRAVAYAQRITTMGMKDNVNKENIVSSKEYAQHFSEVIAQYCQRVLSKGAQAIAAHQDPSEEFRFVESHDLVCHCDHVDGGMNAMEKEEKLQFLRSDPGENQCNILFNVRCLSEGVDVPALDAVALLTPRRSPVEVVQIVGRVMRTAPSKKEGYVIIPVIAHNLKDPASALAHSDAFKVVWEILNALRSINPESVLADPYLHKLDKRIAIICENNNELYRKTGSESPRKRVYGGKGTGATDDQSELFNLRKSALDWVVERCGISIDKDSRIANDYNAFAQEMGDEDYILNLILRVITVSLETMQIVKALPQLTIHPLDR